MQADLDAGARVDLEERQAAAEALDIVVASTRAGLADVGVGGHGWRPVAGFVVRVHAGGSGAGAIGGGEVEAFAGLGASDHGVAGGVVGQGPEGRGELLDPHRHQVGPAVGPGGLIGLVVVGVDEHDPAPPCFRDVA